MIVILDKQDAVNNLTHRVSDLSHRVDMLWTKVGMLEQHLLTSSTKEVSTTTILHMILKYSFYT